MSEPSAFAIFDWRGIEAVTFRFRNWAWQLSRLPACVGAWKPAVRAIVEFRPTPLEEVLARSAWFDFDLAPLKSIEAELRRKLRLERH